MPTTKGTKTMARAPATPAATVSLTGAALLASIASGETTRITQEQAATLDNSHYSANTADVVDGAALVTLTDAGKAAAAAAAPKASIAIDDGVPMPEGKRTRTAEFVYPFDKLEKVGQSFHVPKTAENPDPGTRLSSSVSGARVRYSELVTDANGPVMESYQVPTYQLGADGKPVIGADGKRIVTGKATKTRQKRTEPSRDFKVVTVDASDPRGEGARCFRIK
jgi:hypothetical protein